MKDGKISLEKFKTGISDLEGAFRDAPLPDHRLATYYKFLKELNEGQFNLAVKKIIRTDKSIFYNFFPSIARILEAAGADIEPPPKTLTMEDIKRMQGL